MDQVTEKQYREIAQAKRELEQKVEERTYLLMRAKREWEAAFDSIADPLMIIDNNYQIVRANRALGTHFEREIQGLPGHQCHELRAQSPHRLPRGTDGVCQSCPVRKALASGINASAELVTESEHTYLLSAFPIKGDERGAVVCRYDDLTELRALTRQLAQADKLAAIGLLASGIAHEVNNPLGAVLAYTQLLIREEASPEERTEYLEEIQSNILRCKKIIDRLLKFARQAKHEEHRQFSLNDVVNDISALVEKPYLYGTNIQLEYELEPDLPLIDGNANAMSQVLLNLITNARDALPNGGKVVIRTQALTDEQAVELQVADNGHGIPVHLLERIFDPFFTTKPEGKGTGLGLSVSYGIVRDHRGRISVRSKPGEGTIFSVVLPRTN